MTRTQQSQNLFATAQQMSPGGVSSPMRAWRSVGGDPRFIARGAGAQLERGIYLAPSQFEAAFISLAHSETDIAQTVDAAALVFQWMPHDKS